MAGFSTISIVASVTILIGLKVKSVANFTGLVAMLAHEDIITSNATVSIFIPVSTLGVISN
ncbi:MAG: hypothetical protein VX609_02185 [Verrucomicrobiota bacterium]|nr:hypothetical protein [Verrucomicrobiota bacterium]